jgi:hypothetical protein
MQRLFPSRPKHKAIDDQLAFPAEEVRQCFFALWAIEHVTLSQGI